MCSFWSHLCFRQVLQPEMDKGSSIMQISSLIQLNVPTERAAITVTIAIRSIQLIGTIEAVRQSKVVDKEEFHEGRNLPQEVVREKVSNEYVWS